MGLDYLHKDVEQLYIWPPNRSVINNTERFLLKNRFYIYYITIYDKACRFMELRYYDVLADNYG
jgi:hypothetical protein